MLAFDFSELPGLENGTQQRADDKQHSDQNPGHSAVHCRLTNTTDQKLDKLFLEPAIVPH
jgi:hypothetical protein